MSTMEKLETLQDYLSVLEENNKTIRNGSYLYLLKKMKKEYEKTKEMYLKDKEKLQKIKEEYEKISKDIKSLKKDISDKIVYSNGVSKELKDNNKGIKIKISSLERKGDSLLIKSEQLISLIEDLRIKLINDKNNYISFKEKVDIEVQDARKEIQKVTVMVHEVKSQLPEYIYNRFISSYKISGVGVVKNKNGFCTNCKNNIEEYIKTESFGDTEISSCPVCGGIFDIFSSEKKVVSAVSV